MSVSKKDVQHIARLARIELTPEEEQKFAGDLSAVLEFVEKLKEVDTKNVEPLTGGTTLENTMRQDEQVDKILERKSAELMGAVPEKKDKWVKVKAVFE